MMADEIIAVLDAGPLIHLDEIESLRLLSGYREVLLPEAVEREARSHRPGIQIDSLPGLVRVRPDAFAGESMFEIAAEFGLHAGELAAIAVLKERHGDCLLSDDAAARAMAEIFGFRVRGTVGLILRGWRRNQISKAEARDLLRALSRQSTLHLRPGFLQSVLEQMGD